MHLVLADTYMRIDTTAVVALTYHCDPHAYCRKRIPQNQDTSG